MIDKSLLISGNIIPFPQGQMFITQPKLKNLLLLGEKRFYQSCELITFSKDILNDKDKSLLENTTNFDVLMSIINDDSEQTETSRDNLLSLLFLLFPEYEISFEKNYIVFIKEKEPPHALSNENFEEFKNIVKEIFCLQKKNEQDYNPAGSMSKELADRFKERRMKLAKMKKEESQLDNTILDRYLSILTVGLSLDINILLNYTIYQLYDIFERYTLKEGYDLSMSARLAGASSESLDKVEHWMKDIHS